MYKRYKKVKSYDNTFYGTTVSSPLSGFYKLWNLERKSVIWEIQHPVDLKFSAEYIEINNAPKCPKCEIELEQVIPFLGGYKLRCHECGFELKNKEDWNKVASRVKNGVKRDIE